MSRRRSLDRQAAERLEALLRRVYGPPRASRFLDLLAAIDRSEDERRGD